jgi:hypothetical protein
MFSDCQCPPAPKPTPRQTLLYWRALVPGLWISMLENAWNAAPPVVIARWAMAAVDQPRQP